MIRVDHATLVRGAVEGEETCEIPGIGPVPVSAVRRMCDDAILRVIVTKGVDVVAISTDTRYVAADVQRALDARDPECVVPGCRARHHLQNHHWRYDYAAGSPTDIDHLARVCSYHHALITHCGWTLTGGPGHWHHDPTLRLTTPQTANPRRAGTRRPDRARLPHRAAPRPHTLLDNSP